MNILRSTHHKIMYPLALTAIASIFTLSACTKGEQGEGHGHAEHTAHAPVEIAAPAGEYIIDNTHAMVGFQVSHLGISKYTARFNEFNVILNLDPADISSSTVSATIEADSIDTGYPGDYVGTHKNSGFKSWDEDLALNPKWLDGKDHPTIRFSSRSVQETNGQLEIIGDLTLRGVTHPVTLLATVSGSAEAHPFRKVGTIGFSATGTFNRSEFGMTNLLGANLIGDEVTLLFEGEFLQQVK